MEIIKLLNRDFTLEYVAHCPFCYSVWKYTYEEYQCIPKPPRARCPGCGGTFDLDNHKHCDVIEVDIDD